MCINDFISKIRIKLLTANSNLNKAMYQEIKNFFLHCINNPELIDNLSWMSFGYEKKEFLPNVDETGRLVSTDKSVIEDYKKTVNEHRQFGLWFTERRDKQNNQRLLVARWLSHLVGIRHRCSHIFIDHPEWKDYTLIQVRSFNKIESPGCFDLPVGGHSINLDSTKATAKKELREELNIGLNDFENFSEIGSYNFTDPFETNILNNVEFRTVFCGKLKPDGLLKMKFMDKEVSAIAIFEMQELLIMIDKFPERIASGLLNSIPLYISYKTINSFKHTGLLRPKLFIAGD
ncbi:MAG: NUDIX domain-containing protein [Candidatus Brocadiales bacterium]